MGQKLLIDSLFVFKEDCRRSHERKERKAREFHFQHTSVLLSWGAYINCYALEKGRIIKISPSPGTFDPQMVPFVFAPSPVTSHQWVRKSFGTGSVPPRWHMLCWVAFYSLFPIKISQNSYAIIRVYLWKSSKFKVQFLLDTHNFHTILKKKKKLNPNSETIYKPSVTANLVLYTMKIPKNKDENKGIFRQMETLSMPPANYHWRIYRMNSR